MLEQVLKYINNYFAGEVQSGTFTVEDEGIVLPSLLPGQYFRIVGSVFNDGVYKYPASGLTNETFTGEIWALKIPRAVLTLVDDITAWADKYGEQAASPYVSETMTGVYSYTKGEGADGGAAATWQGTFRARLNQWRKL